MHTLDGSHDLVLFPQRECYGIYVLAVNNAESVIEQPSWQLKLPGEHPLGEIYAMLRC